MGTAVVPFFKIQNSPGLLSFVMVNCMRMDFINRVFYMDFLFIYSFNSLADLD